MNHTSSGSGIGDRAQSSNASPRQRQDAALAPTNFTPRETVSELDRYIIGQDKAKRAVAVALRNRWRRSQVEDDLRDEISPKNIVMIGPTGVGKTEIARRLAKLAKAPFIKVEASKFTEVGYVGRDVESMIRDLVELAIKLVREERATAVQHRARELAEDRLVEALCRQKYPPATGAADNGPPAGQGGAGQTGPIQFGPIFVTPPPGSQVAGMPAAGRRGPRVGTSATESQRDEVRKDLRDGKLEDEPLEVEVAPQGNPFMTIFGQNGMEEMELNLRDLMNTMGKPGGPGKKRSVSVVEARGIFERQEADKLVDMDRVQREALQRTEQSGIVFLDEIDKVASAQSGKAGPDVSREGVQRDLLPIVEGSTVTTKYGPVKTDHILFIAAGAFHVSSVSDLIPELQGRFPIRVELEALEEKDLVRILTEPKTALTKQYTALMKTEGLDLTFTDDAVEAVAAYAAEANRRNENIGARRLHTVLEALLEEISFTAPEQARSKLMIDAAYVRKTLEPIMNSEELSRYIL